MPNPEPDPHVDPIRDAEIPAILSSHRKTYTQPPARPELTIVPPLTERQLSEQQGPADNTDNTNLSSAEISPPLRRPALQAKSISLNDLITSDPIRGNALLADYYREFRQAFRDPDEIRSAQDYRSLITNNSGLWIDVLVVGGQVVGAANTRVISTPEGRIGITEHIFIRDDFRGMGLGRHLNQLVNFRAAEAGAIAIVQEVTDPRLANQKKRALDTASGIDPEGRIEFWKKQGFMALDAPYAQPQLADGKMPVYCDMLTIKPLDAKLKSEGKLSVESYLALIRSYFQSFLEDVDSDPTYQMLLKSKDHLVSVDFIPIDEPRKALFPAFWAFVRKCNSGTL